MKRLLRHSRLTILGILLVLGSLTIAARTSPAAHAACSPSITASGSYGTVLVSGTCFTPSGKVFVEVFDSSWTYVNGTFATAAGPHLVCRLTGFGVLCSRDPGGEINTGLYENPGYVHVIAYDYSSATWSNWSTTYVRIIP